MRIPLSAIVTLAALGACHRQAADPASGKTATVHVAGSSANDGDHVTVSIPGFDARLKLPDMDLGKHVDLDGIRLAPGTTVKGIDIDARDKGSGNGDGRVRLSFTNPQAPAALVDYYRAQADAAGYAGVTAGAGTLAATKGEKTFALAVSPAAGGSAGSITVAGGK